MKKAETSITICYWATTDKRVPPIFKKAKNLEDRKIESGGINVSPKYYDECIVIDIKGYKGIQLINLEEQEKYLMALQIWIMLIVELMGVTKSVNFTTVTFMIT